MPFNLILHLLAFFHNSFHPALAQEGLRLDSSTPGNSMSEKISTLLSSGLVLHETPQLKPLSDELDETGKTQGEIRDTVYFISSSYPLISSFQLFSFCYSPIQCLYVSFIDCF